MKIKVTVEEIYDLRNHPDTGEPIKSHEEAIDIFNEDRSWWSDRWEEWRIRMIEPHEDME